MEELREMIRPGAEVEASVLRARQVLAAEANVVQSMWGLGLATLGTTAFFYQTWGSMAISWCAAVFVVCGARLMKGRRTTANPPARASRSDIAVLSIWSALVALVASSFPIWVTMKSGGFEFAYMMTFSLGIFWSAAFIHAPVIPNATAFIISQVAMGFFAAILAGLDWTRIGLAILFVIGAGSAIQVVRQLSETFRRSILQQLELEQKSEVIRDLLRDHEDQSSDWLWQTDAELRIIDPSHRFAEALSMAGADFAGQSLHLLLGTGQGHETTEALDGLESKMANRRSFRDLTVPLGVGAKKYWFSISGRPVIDASGEFRGYRGVMSDVTDVRLAQREVDYLARFDALTGAANRTQMIERLESTLLEKKPFSVLSIDLEGFNSINNLHGQESGDALLRETAKRLAAGIGDHDLVARFGSDEFMVLTLTTVPENVRRLCHRLADIIGRPLTGPSSGRDMVVGATIGVAIAPQDGVTGAELLQNADTALCRAKHDDRGSVRFFSAELDCVLQQRQRLLYDLRMAVQCKELHLNYQPLIDARTGAVNGAEALIRWSHPVRGLVSPAEFIPMAEEGGLIDALGDYVLEAACAEAADWPVDKRVSINVSPIQFRNRDLPARILATLHKTGLSPDRLIVEVTETTLVNDVQAALDTLRSIRSFGVHIALDDFGTGYSSLSYLQLFPFDKIKIDRAFVDQIDTRHKNRIIVQAIRDIAVGFGMTITAEGVETSTQATQLFSIGCDEFQGFLFSRPLSAQAFRQTLETRFAA